MKIVERNTKAEPKWVFEGCQVTLQNSFRDCSVCNCVKSIFFHYNYIFLSFLCEERVFSLFIHILVKYTFAFTTVMQFSTTDAEGWVGRFVQKGLLNESTAYFCEGPNSNKWEECHNSRWGKESSKFRHHFVTVPPKLVNADWGTNSGTENRDN